MPETVEPFASAIRSTRRENGRYHTMECQAAVGIHDRISVDPETTSLELCGCCANDGKHPDPPGRANGPCAELIDMDPSEVPP